jgi:hypothetical protein
MVARKLTDRQVAELLDLLGGTDSVELKLTVPDRIIRSAADSLGMDPLEAEIRQVAFFDTPDLTLNQAGIVVRARRIQGGAGDTVVKLRPVEPGSIPPDLRLSGSVGVEVDAMPGGFVCSASMKGKSSSIAVRDVLLGRAKIGSIFSKEQKAFFGSHSPDGLKLGSLAILGPINILKLKFDPKKLGRKLVAELWLYPDGSRLLELSTKCRPDEAFQVAAEARAFLASHGIDMEGRQETKTKKALDYFSRPLRTASTTLQMKG